MKRPTNRKPLIGHACVSTDEQATEAQEFEFRAAGCETIWSNTDLARHELGRHSPGPSII